MTILEAIASAITEVVAYVVGRIAGRTFNLEPKKAQAVGAYVVLGVIAGAATFVTFYYS